MRKRILVFCIFVLFISFLLFFIDNQETIKLRKIKDIEILEKGVSLCLVNYLIPKMA